MAIINSTQEITTSQNQPDCDIPAKKKVGYHRVQTIRMDFGGNLSLTKSGIWIYVRGSGKYRTTKSTKQRDYDKAVDVARRMHTSSIITKGVPIDWDDDKHYRVTFNRCRNNARQRKIEFFLSEDDMATLVARSQGRCELTGIVFQKIAYLGSGEMQPFMPSIDRIDSSKGYSVENCRIICAAANLAINSWGDWVLMELMRAMHIKHGNISTSVLEKRIKKSRNRKLQNYFE